jgi:four helix bundle protein
MPFDHEKLDVYTVALDFVVLANGVVEGLPRGRSHLADQLTRASISIVLNIAEGAGKYSPADKRRYYLSATGSATECAAILDICRRLAFVDDATHRSGKELLDRIVAMLVALAKRLDNQR